MPQPFDKITDASFQEEHHGLVWVQSAERERTGPDEYGLWYDFWILVQRGTDRVFATIDGPTEQQLCYGVSLENGTSRKFLSEEGAKRWALGVSTEYVIGINVERAMRRKLRTLEKKPR